MGAKARWGVSVLLLALASTACGGKGQVDGGGGGASSSGASSSGASSSGASSGGASSMDCPVEPPASGDACNYAGLANCSYPIDHCTYMNFECRSGVWVSIQTTGGASRDCSSFYPPNAPKDGDSCECLGKLDCAFDDCTGRGRIRAECDDTTWHVTESACVKQACGPAGTYCEPGEVCVVHPQGLPTTFACKPNPCTSTPTSCDCAAMLCGPSESCSIDSGSVTCDCPTC